MVHSWHSDGILSAVNAKYLEFLVSFIMNKCGKVILRAVKVKGTKTDAGHCT